MQPKNLQHTSKGRRAVPGPLDGSDKKGVAMRVDSSDNWLQAQWWEEASWSRTWSWILKNQDKFDQQRGGEEEFPSYKGSL